jgi:hypothetical protein
MFQRCWPGLLLFLCGTTAPAFGQVKLEWKLKEGDRFYLEEKSLFNQTMKFMGSPIKHALKQTRVSRFTVLKKNDDSSYLMEQKILAVRIDPTGDSARADVRMVKDLEGAVFKFTLGPRLRVGKFEGYDALVKKMARNEQVGKMLRALMPEAAFSRPLDALFGFLPEKAVEQGGHWTFTLVKPLGLLGVVKLDNSYTFQKTEKVEKQDAVKLEVATTRSTFTPSGATTGLTFRVVKGDVKVDREKTSGTIYWSADRGRLISSDQKTHLTGSLTVDAMGNMLGLELDQEESVTARLLEKNPLEK